MRSKFKNKIVFWNEEWFKDKKGRSPYLIILNVYKEYRPKLTGGDRFIVEYIDKFGNEGKIKTTQHYMYKGMEILDLDKVKHLQKDFIKGILK